MSEKPTIAERYSSALNSTHLEMHMERRGAVDFLCAMGLACAGQDKRRETLGSLLLRLTIEFSAAKGEYTQAKRLQVRAHLEAKDKRDPDEAAAIESQADADALSAHAHILLKLPSLARTKNAFGNFANVMANQHRFMQFGPMPTDIGKMGAWRQEQADRANVIRILSGRVLDVFLEPTCLRCSGRGILSSAYEGKMQTFCPSRGGCGGSGKRRIDAIGNNKDQHAFSGMLYSEAQQLLSNVERQVALKMRD